MVIAERGISSRHAQLHIDAAGRLVITDLGSTNGTFVNGEPVTGGRVITSADEVFVCHVQIAVLDVPPPPAAEPEPAPVRESTAAMPMAELGGPARLDALVLEPAEVPALLVEPPPVTPPPTMTVPVEGPPALPFLPPSRAPLEAGELGPSPSLVEPASASIEAAEPCCEPPDVRLEPPVLVELAPEPVEPPPAATTPASGDSEPPSCAGPAAADPRPPTEPNDPFVALRDDPEVRRVILRGLDWLEVDRGDRPRAQLASELGSVARVHAGLEAWLRRPVVWDDRCPWLDATAPDGSRVQAAHPSVAPGGPIVVLTRATVPAAVELGPAAGLPDAIADYLRTLLQASGSVVVAVDEACEGTALLSACAEQLAGPDPATLALVHAGVAMPSPAGAMALVAEPGLTCVAIRLAVDAGARRLVVHRGDGAGLASAWAGLRRGLAQLVVSVRARDAGAAVEVCVDGLALGGYGRERELLRRHVAASVDAIVTISADASGREVVTGLAELDEHGVPVDILRRPAPDQPWRHHASPAFLPVIARQGLEFDAARLAALAQP